MIKSWGLLEVPLISFMDEYHVLIQLQSERDFVHAWMRVGHVIDECVLKLFRWTKEFDLYVESSLVPQWIFLLGLPLHMYRANCLQILATRFGRYLGIDNATLNKMRATGLCVEVGSKGETHQRIYDCSVGKKNYLIGSMI